MLDARDVVAFWREAGPSKWFGGGDAFDARCREQLLTPHLLAAKRELDHWLEGQADHGSAPADGALALVLLLDQVPRNVFRGSPHAFATDPLARHFAERALAAGHDQAFEPALRAFFYLPLEHSEDPADQARSVALFEALGNANYLKYAIDHRDVITRFGRFPHRNAAFGRETSPAEQAWLDAGGGW